ncbi:golgin family A protein [Fagus crenata]
MSARKLAATLWEMNEISPPSLRAREISDEMQLRKKEVIIGRERMARSIHSGSLPPHLFDPSHSLVSEVMEFKFQAVDDRPPPLPQAFQLSSNPHSHSEEKREKKKK